MSVRRLWVPVVVALLVAALIGPGMVAGAEPKVLVTRSVMLAAAAAGPTTDDVDYAQYDNRLEVNGIGNFVIPLSFPVPTVIIKRVTLYAYDDDPGSVVAVLVRTYPPDQGSLPLAEVATGDSVGVQAVTTTEIGSRTVNTANYGLHLHISVGESHQFFGVKITYAYEV